MSHKKHPQDESIEQPASAEASTFAKATADTSAGKPASTDPNAPLALEHPSYEELEAKLTEMEGQKEQLLRALADKENQLRRVQTELEKERKFAVTKLVQDMLAVVDSLELSIQSIAKNTDDTIKPVREGVSLTLQMLQNTLSKHGLQPVQPETAEAFNPEFHEAMSMQEHPDIPAGQIVAVLQKGYLLHGRLIRPAMVMVSK